MNFSNDGLYNSDSESRDSHNRGAQLIWEYRCARKFDPYEPNTRAVIKMIEEDLKSIKQTLPIERTAI